MDTGAVERLNRLCKPSSCRAKTDCALEIEQALVARPTGLERTDATRIRIPIEGAGEWLKLSRESA